MSDFTDFLVKVDDLVWGIPLIVLILAAGIYLTFRLRLQIVHLPKALKYMFKNEEDGHGEVSSFGALCTALSATIGTGNIVGVATAIGCTALGTAVGGPGALFWMWVAAFFGMATKYAEGFLAVRYRTIDEEGHVLGGPFYYIENGMGHKWKWLAKVFSFFGACVGLFGIGTFTQVNGIASAVQSFFDPNKEDTVSILGTDYSIAIVITAFALAICVGLVVIGGIKRISSVSQVIVPFMAILYIVTVLVLIVTNIEKLPGALATIVEYAFGVKAVAGGVLSSIAISMQKGIARGIFSNEAGLGSAPIAAAAMMDSYKVVGLEGVQVTTHAFQNGLSFLPAEVSSFILMVCLVFFAFTTILGWDYYGERCLEYLSNKSKTAVQVYRWLYILAVFIGPYMTVKAVWTIADIFNGLMAIPNIIALFTLSGVVAKETKEHFEKKKQESK